MADERDIPVPPGRDELLASLRHECAEPGLAGDAFRAIVERDVHAVLLVRQAQVAYANPAAAALFGRPSSDLAGAHVEELLDFVLPLDRDDARLCLLHDPASPRDTQAEFRVVRSRGEFRVVEALSSSLTLEGQPARRVLLVDVTDERRQRVELRRSRDELRAILAGLTDAILVTDPFDQVVYANDTASELLGFVSRDDLMKASGEGLFEYVLVLEHDGRQVPFGESPTARVAREGTPLSASYYIRQADRGHVRFVTLHATPVLDVARRVTRVVTVFHDLTDVRRAEAERRRLEGEVLRAQKSESLAVMAGGIAHDFNNLLMIIRGNVEMANQDEVSPADIKPYIQRIGDAADRAAELARQMLAYTGRASFEVARIPLNTLLSEQQSLLRSAISRKARLTFTLAEGLPEVLGDAARLRQVVLNLVRNASDALENNPGEIRVATTLEHLDRATLRRLAPQPMLPEGRYVVLTVADTGTGIAPELRGRIFEPFFTTRAGGRGLGLAACDGIVRSHSGGIAVESRPGHGAIFRVLLPVDGKVAFTGEADLRAPSVPPPLPHPSATPHLVPTHATPAPPHMAPAAPVHRPAAVSRPVPPPTEPDQPAIPPPFQPAPAATSPAPAPAAAWRGTGIVLLADDEPDVRFVARRHLEKLGFDVVEATNGGEAVEHVKERPHAYVAALLDYAMPVMNGAEAAQAIHQVRPDLPVIIASGYTAEDLGGRHGVTGVAGLIEKPYERSRLAIVLKRALETTP
jgi:PAS domain S-box-containing protein